MKKMTQLRMWISEKFIPLYIWIAYAQKTNWVSYHAKKLIKKYRQKDKKSFTQKVSEKWFEWMHPQNWKISFSLSLLLIIVPQFLLGAISMQNFTFIDSDFLATVWQVLASI